MVLPYTAMFFLPSVLICRSIIAAQEDYLSAGLKPTITPTLQTKFAKMFQAGKSLPPLPVQGLKAIYFK